MEEQNTAYIDDYFHGTLPPEERHAFELRIENDPAFAEEVAFYVSALQVMRNQLNDERKERFHSIYEQQKSQRQPAVVKKLIPYLAAAAVIAALFIGINVLTSSPSLQQMTDNYIDSELSTMYVKMASRKDSIDIGRNLFNDGKLNESLEQFKKLIRSDTSATYLKIYAGIVSLRLQQYDSAIVYFTQAESNTSDYTNRGKFLHAVALLKRNGPNDKQNARILLQQVVDDNLEGKEFAEKWLKKFEN
ncbi:MAG: hypothetical protein QM731_15560 [Chitinophagaceae bacterium]